MKPRPLTRKLQLHLEQKRLSWRASKIKRELQSLNDIKSNLKEDSIPHKKTAIKEIGSHRIDLIVSIGLSVGFIGSLVWFILTTII